MCRFPSVVPIAWQLQSISALLPAAGGPPDPFPLFSFSQSASLSTSIRGEQVLGWLNLKVVDRRLRHELGFAGSRPSGRAFQLALDERLAEFLDL